jgi:hypothetical protein
MIKVHKSNIALCLYGKYNNRLDSEAGDSGFQYIKTRILDEYDPDVFIYSSDLGNKNHIVDMYKPWLVKAEFVKEPNFKLIQYQHGIQSSLFTPIEEFRTLENTLAFLFSRSGSIDLMKQYAQTRTESYDWVIVARFDLGQLDKVNGVHSHKVSEIGFVPKLDSSYIYSAQWRQHNIGVADQWFFSSQNNIEILNQMYNWALEKFKPNSTYLSTISNGVPDSNSNDQFSNEFLKCGPKSTDLVSVNTRSAINNHLLHKIFLFEQKNLYQNMRFTSDFRSAANIVYTHSDCKDVWPVFFRQLEKHTGPFKSNYVFINQISAGIPNYFEQIVYDDNLTYTDRLIHCLNQVSEDVFLLQHEDMILYDTPDVTKLINLIEELQNDNSRFDVAKLVSGGRFIHIPISGHSGFRRIWRHSPWTFSIQPSLWKKSSFQNLLNQHRGQSIWEFEVNAQKTVRELRLKILSPKRYRPKRGRHHWDNPFYPVISTAISKGKWSTSEYGLELGPILDDYNIDPKVRGTV